MNLWYFLRYICGYLESIPKNQSFADKTITILSIFLQIINIGADIMIKVYSRKKDGNLRVSTNFKVKEFACNDGSDPIFIDTELVDILQKIRNYFDKPVTITSAYRTPTHNKNCGGTTYSQHLYGRAADIKISSVTPGKVAKYAETILKNGGIGIYNTFVHIDVRSTKSRWQG